MIAIIIAAFVIGYLAIAFEHSIKINKAASALITGVTARTNENCLDHWHSFFFFNPWIEI